MHGVLELNQEVLISTALLKNNQSLRGSSLSNLRRGRIVGVQFDPNTMWEVEVDETEKAIVPFFRYDPQGNRFVITNERVPRDVASSLLNDQQAAFTISQLYFEQLGRGGMDLMVESEKHQAQVGFLMSHFSPMVELESGKGVQTLIQQWEMYTSSHADLQLALEDSYVTTTKEEGGGGSTTIETFACLKLVISRRTIENIYPELLSDQELVQKLIGKELKMLCQIIFVFDEHHKCVKFDAVLDYIGAWHRILQDLDKVKQILQDSNVQGNYTIPPPSSE